MRNAFFVLALTLTLLPRPAAALPPRFDGLGDLAGGAVSSVAQSISADGQVVVGASEGANGLEAVRWTQAGGLSGLGFLPGGSAPSVAFGVSANGAVIVGMSLGSDGVERAYRWSSGTMTALGRQSCQDCQPSTTAWAVSANGLVAVGSSVARSSGGDLHLDPVRWPNGGTSLSNLGNLPSSNEIGEAFGASSTGSVIVGQHFTFSGAEAWRWTGSGLSALPAATTLTPRNSAALAVSSDGSTAVGFSSKGTVTLPGGTVVPSRLQAVRWSGANLGTLTELGSLPSAPLTRSQALATNSNGSLIVGYAANADADDRAFIWDAASGMRDLKQVLVDDFGLDLFGWVLTEATGISDVAAGAFYVVGNGINPAGQPEAWIAYLSVPECRNGIDDDGDGDIDHPADDGCTSPIDWSEQADCNDGVDNDGDGDVDFPADGDCLSALDATEQPDCDDGLDNDGDGLVDLQDPGCAGPGSLREDPACSDGLDNDGDLFADFPADAGCRSASDLSEVFDCSDGLDNDGDGLVDHPADPECASASGASEAAQCSDGLDNDGDGRTDYPEQYPGCTSPDDATEAAACSDGVDNDDDGDIDYPADADCASAFGESESPVDLWAGGLFAVDRKSRSVFRVDPSTGEQTLVSAGAWLQAPQGIDRRGTELLVADPTGLVRVDGAGVQVIETPPLLPHESLQVAVDAAGTAYVLEADGIWANAMGSGTKTPWLPVPSPEPLPNLGELTGDTLVLEPGGALLTTGQGFLGGGLMRVSPPTPTVLPVILGVFDGVLWLDLALEPAGSVIAVGSDLALGVGVYRVDPTTGARSVLNDSHPWVRPTGVAVDAVTGDIYVAEAGVCADGACNGGEIVRIDPITGAASVVTSGGFIEGELDLVYLPEPASGALWMIGSLTLSVLARVRMRSRGAAPDDA